MTDSDRKKKRQTLVEGFNKVPKILEEARRAVDEATQRDLSESEAPVQEEKEAKPAPRVIKAKTARKALITPKRQPIAKAKKGKKQVTKTKPKQGLGDLTLPAPERPRTPLRTLDYYGIRIKHHLYGRIRLRIPKMKYNPEFAARIKKGLAEVKGIADVEASAATGSLLVVFNPKELAVLQSRQAFTTHIEGFFPGLDTETLIRKFL